MYIQVSLVINSIAYKVYTLVNVILKLVRTNLNYPELSTTGILFQMIILSMHLLPWKNAMLDFICIGSVDLLRAFGKQKYTKWKLLGNSGTWNPQAWAS